MRYYVLLFAISMLPVSAYASSPISHVGGASVNKGETSVEFRFGYTEDDSSSSNDDRTRMRQHIDYGFNDWYALRVITLQDKRKNDSFEHQAFTVENRFQLIEKREHGWDGGIRLIYTHSDGDKTPHEAEVRFLAQVPFSDGWEFRHNTMLEHDIGENSDDGFLLEFRTQVIKELDVTLPHFNSLDLGVEMFNDFGRLSELSGYERQDHQIGPVLKASFDNGLYFQTGYRAGISKDAANYVFKFALGRKF